METVRGADKSLAFDLNIYLLRPILLVLFPLETGSCLKVEGDPVADLLICSQSALLGDADR